MTSPEPDCKTVTKKELVNRIAEDTGQTKVVVKDILQRFLDSIISELSEGNRLEFREFGVFEVRERAARKAQNPRTLEKVFVPAKRVVKFKVGRTMRERVCEEPRPERPRSPGPEPSAPPQPPPAPSGGFPSPATPKPPPTTPNSPF
ncbi:MAG: HU family DNA-binding protein [Planctomycetota bacterium]